MGREILDLRKDVDDAFSRVQVEVSAFEQNILYFGKHGSDSSDGSTKAKAFKTITAALVKAASLVPSPTNRIVLYCVDGGYYTEDLSMLEWTGVIAPAALIEGQHTIPDNSLIHSFRLVSGAAGECITKSSGTGAATILCPRMILSNGANGVLCTSGSLNYFGDSMEVENGFGVGDLTTGQVSACVQSILITGTGIGIGIASSGDLDFTGLTIRDTGSGTGIFCSSTGHAHVTVNHLECNVAYNVGPNSSLRLITSELVGSQQGTGKIYVTVAGIGDTKKATVTITPAQLTEAGVGVSQSINIGSALPENAYVLAHTLRDVTAFSGGGVTAVDLDIGGDDPDAIVAGEDMLGGGISDREGLLGVNPTGRFSAQQLKARFTPDAGHSLSQLAGGAVTIDVMYSIVE